MLQEITTPVNNVDVVAMYTQGEVYYAPDGKKYVYGQYRQGSGSVTRKTGHILVPFTASNDFGDGAIFTADLTNSTDGARGSAVVAMGPDIASTKRTFGWFGNGGVFSVVQSRTGDVSDGDLVAVSGDKTVSKYSTTINSTVTNVATIKTNQIRPFGMALQDFSTTSSVSRKNIRFFGHSYH